MVYHPGKILKIVNSHDNISEGKTTEALLEMWDENVFIFKVVDEIADKVKEGDIVLVDYYPILSGNSQIPVPRHIITKVLKKDGKYIWERFIEFRDILKSKAPQRTNVFG